MARSSALTLLFTLAVTACGDDAPAEDSSTATMGEAMQQATEAIRQQAGDVEPVSAEALQDRLPADVGGIERVDVERTSTGAMGMQISAVVGHYRKTDGRQVTIVISDIGGMGATGMMGAAAWAMTDFDRTTDTGYERTGRFEGFKVMESLSREGSRVRTQLAIVVGERFIVQLEGRGVDMDVLRDAAKGLDLRGLARMS